MYYRIRNKDFERLNEGIYIYQYPYFWQSKLILWKDIERLQIADNQGIIMHYTHLIGLKLRNGHDYLIETDEPEKIIEKLSMKILR